MCHIEISIDLEGEAIDLEEAAARKGKQAKQGILSRLNLDVSDIASCISIVLMFYRIGGPAQNWRPWSKSLRSCETRTAL